MSRPVILSADSTCDLGAALCERFDVHIVPYHVVVEGEQYLDGVTIDPDRIYEIYRERKVLPHTAAINVDDYLSAFVPFVEQGFDVVHLTLGHGLSSSAQNCRIAAEEVGHVWVVDTCNLSTGSGLLVLEAAKRIAAGMEAAQIAAEVETLIPCCHASFVLNTLEFLHKGGRCSALAMLGANVLQLKPCIEVNTADGTMAVGKKYRGAITKAREQYVRDQLSRDDLDYEKIFFTHSGLPDDQLEAILRVIRECGDFKEIFVTRAGCTISSHCGPDCMGVLFMTKQ